MVIVRRVYCGLMQLAQRQTESEEREESKSRRKAVIFIFPHLNQEQVPGLDELRINKYIFVTS